MSWLDGYRTYTFVNPQPSAPVYESRDGQIWSIYHGGLQQFKDGHWRKYPIKDVNLDTPFLPTLADHVLVLLPSRLLHYDAETNQTTILKINKETKLGRFIDFTPAQDGGLWITGRNGIAKAAYMTEASSSRTQWVDYDIEGLDVKNLREPYEGKKGELLVVADSLRNAQNLLIGFDGSRWNTLYGDRELIRGWRGVDGGIWIQTEHSLIQLASDKKKDVLMEGVLAGEIRDVAIQSDGAFWVTTTQGVARYALPTWQAPSAVANIQTTVHAFAEDQAGRIWFISQDALVRYEKETRTIYSLPEGVHAHHYETEAFSFLPDGRLIMNCTKSRHLLAFDPKNASFELIQHPAGRHVRMIAPRRDGTVWVRTRERNERNYRLEIYDGHQFKSYVNLNDNEKLIHIRHLCETENEDLWIGDLYGLSACKRMEPSTYQAAKGYPGAGAIFIHEIAGGKIWVGDRNKIHEFDGAFWKVILTDIDSVRSIMTARDGSIWVASDIGLHRFRNGSWVSLGEEEGLPSEIVYTAFEDSQQRMWVGTAKGIVLYHPEADPDAPETFISDKYNLTETPPSGDVRLIYSGIDKWKYTLQERLLFSYRLDAADWSPFTSNTFASYTRLPAGPHRFQVRAMDRNWNIDPTPATFEFAVLLPWHHTTEFIAILTCSTILILFLIGVAFSHNIKLERVVRVRTADLEWINQTLKHEISERKLAEEALEISERLYREAIEVADAVPYYRNYLTDAYEFVGDGIETLIGYTKEEFTPALWNSMIKKTVLMGNAAGLSREEAVQRARNEDGGSWRSDTLVETRWGDKRWLANAAVEVRNEQGVAIGSLGILQDITERKLTENALRDSEARNRALLNAIPDLIVRIHKDGTYLDYKSPKDFHPIFRLHNAIGKNVNEVLPPKVARQVMFHLQKTLRTGKTEIFEYHLESNGRQRECEARIVTSGADEVLAIVRDISERKRLEKEILKISEIERQRIGDELHDDLCQNLTGIAIHSKVLEERLASGSLPEAPDAAEITKQINQAISKTRILAKGLHPVNLEANGLIPSLEELAANSEHLFGISCLFRYEKSVHIDDNTTAVHLYRIAQEALNNAVKHGHTNQIRIELAKRDNQVTLTIEDNGVGIPDETENSAGMGLRIMNYRARIIGASLEIRKNPVGGTIVVCSFESRDGKPYHEGTKKG
jgi:PAS domain S-box-containing protein